MKERDFVKELFNLVVWLDENKASQKAEDVYYAALYMKKLEEALEQRGKRMYS